MGRKNSKKRQKQKSSGTSAEQTSNEPSPSSNVAQIIHSDSESSSDDDDDCSHCANCIMKEVSEAFFGLDEESQTAFLLEPILDSFKKQHVSNTTINSLLREFMTRFVMLMSEKENKVKKVLDNKIKENAKLTSIIDERYSGDKFAQIVIPRFEKQLEEKARECQKLHEKNMELTRKQLKVNEELAEFQKQHQNLATSYKSMESQLNKLQRKNNDEEKKLRKKLDVLEKEAKGLQFNKKEIEKLNALEKIVLKKDERIEELDKEVEALERKLSEMRAKLEKGCAGSKKCDSVVVKAQMAQLEKEKEAIKEENKRLKEYQSNADEVIFSLEKQSSIKDKEMEELKKKAAEARSTPTRNVKPPTKKMSSVGCQTIVELSPPPPPPPPSQPHPQPLMDIRYQQLPSSSNVPMFPPNYIRQPIPSNFASFTFPPIDVMTDSLSQLRATCQEQYMKQEQINPSVDRMLPACFICRKSCDKENNKEQCNDCGNHFHSTCVLPWIRNKGRCPTCRLNM